MCVCVYEVCVHTHSQHEKACPACGFIVSKFKTGDGNLTDGAFAAFSSTATALFKQTESFQSVCPADGGMLTELRSYFIHNSSLERIQVAFGSCYRLAVACGFSTGRALTAVETGIPLFSTCLRTVFVKHARNVEKWD